MFGLFSAPRRPVTRMARRPARLQVEALETRYCPAALNPTVPELPGAGTHGFHPADSGPPTISSLRRTISGSNAYISGIVFGDSSYYIVTLDGGGVFTGQTVTAGSGGSFTFTVHFNAHQGGNVTITATDEYDQTSSPSYCYVGCPEIVSLEASQGSNNVWTFTGLITAVNVGGVRINFGGTASTNGKSTTTASDGSFFLQIQLQAGESGTVWATATDSIGTSQTAYVAVG